MKLFNNNETDKPFISTALAVILIVALGLCIRLYFLAKTDFVLNDGGMFYTMIVDLQTNKYNLPIFISYNFSQIPFAYPPLSFYIAALLNDWLQVDLVTIFRFLPLIFNVLSIPAFFFLAREITQNKRQALLATAFYAILPPGYEWLISGGGLTRAPAQLFFILSLYFFMAYTNRQKRSALFLSIFCASLMTLHHLEYCLLLAISIFVFLVRVLSVRSFIKTILLYFFGAALLTAPYWITILLRYGVSPLLSAFSSGEFSLITSIARLLSMSFTDEILVNYVNVLAIIGLFYCLFAGKFRLIIWFLLITLLSPRSVNRPLIFPVTIFASIAIDSIILPELDRLYKKSRLFFEANQMGNQKRFTFPSFGHVFIAFSILYPFFLGFIAPSDGGTALNALKESEIKAMEWVRYNTPEESQFVILDDADTWGVDKANEWFPALAQRKSQTTVQGTEWLAKSSFEIQKRNYYDLKECGKSGVSCLKSWTANNTIDYSYVYVTKEDCNNKNGTCLLQFEMSIRQSDDFQKVFENDEVLIFKSDL